MGNAPFLLATPLAESLALRHEEKNAANAQAAYLRELGVAVSDEAARELWFRGLAVPSAEREALRARLPRPLPADARRGLAALYGSAQTWRGLLVIAPKNTAVIAALDRLHGRLCRKNCPFFDPKYLTRITVTGAAGLAAYLPETESLVLSRELLEKPDALHDFVVIHELAHVAALGRGWRAKPVVTHPRWHALDDELTRLSTGSPYSLLPDGYAFADQARDGVVVRRGWEAAKTRGDEEEILADTIAAYFVVPERFCREETAVAPRAWRWLHEKVLETAAVGEGCPKARRGNSAGSSRGNLPD